MSSIGRVRVNRAGDPHRLVAGNAEQLDLVGFAERSVWKVNHGNTSTNIKGQHGKRCRGWNKDSRISVNSEKKPARSCIENYYVRKPCICFDSGSEQKRSEKRWTRWIKSKSLKVLEDSLHAAMNLTNLDVWTSLEDVKIVLPSSCSRGINSKD